MRKVSIYGIILMCVMGIVLTSCGSDDDDDAKPLEVSPRSVSMKYDESQQLSASGATSWRSENEFVATVDQNGLVKGNHIGSTDIIVSNGSTSGKCSVTITPKYAFFDLPVLSWGVGETAIRNAETHGTPEKSGDYLLYKYDNGTIPVVVMYSFKNGLPTVPTVALHEQRIIRVSPEGNFTIAYLPSLEVNCAPVPAERTKAAP